MVDRLEPDVKVLFVATLPMFITAFLSFWLLTRKSNQRLPLLSAVSLPAVTTLVSLTGSVCLLVYMLRDIESTAHQYYWQHQPELAETINGEPVIQNLLFRWIDEPPTAASTEDRAWLFGEASRRYRLEARSGWMVVVFVLPLIPVLIWRRPYDSDVSRPDHDDT